MADPNQRLTDVLIQIQRRGGIGPQPIDAALEHADRFARAIPPEARTAADLGSGGGLPGLVIAVRHPELELHLIERRSTRADLLRFGVAALALGDRVHVHAADVRDVAASGLRFDVVTARSFASTEVTMTTAVSILRSGGCILVSVAPDVTEIAVDERTLGVVSRGVTDGIARFDRAFHVEHAP